MIRDNIVYLLIFALLLLLISSLFNVSLFKLVNLKQTKLNIKEGLDECSQNEKDELFKQKIKINEIQSKNNKISNKIRDLEKFIDKNKKHNKKNENVLKEIANSAQGDINKQGKQADNIKM
jgi:predicted nuclease with TOPRIM domain